MENNNDIENKIFLSLEERREILSSKEINKIIKDELNTNGYEDWQIDYATERIEKMIYGKKDIPEIKKMFDLFFKDNPIKFEEMLKLEKQLSGTVDLIISDANVTQNHRNLVGDVFITDKYIYFITTKIIDLSKNMPIYAYTGGALGALIGGGIESLINKPKTFEKNDEIPLNVLARYVDGSFRVDLSNILLVRINDRNNFFVIKTKDNNQWVQNFSAKNSEDKEKIIEVFSKKSISVEFAKGFFKKLLMG